MTRLVHGRWTAPPCATAAPCATGSASALCATGSASAAVATRFTLVFVFALMAAWHASPLLADRPQRTRDITFDDIKFEMDKEEPFERSMLTDDIEALVGKTIRIRGYILPSFKQSGLTQFVLVRDNMECCFGPGAALFDCVIVEMEQGKSAEFSVRPVAVEGVFSVKELMGPDGKHLAIYHLVGKSVK